MARRVPYPRAAAVEFGRRVHERRRLLYMTQMGLARAVGVERGFISSMENGQAPSFGTLLALAIALRTDPAELVRGLHEMAS
jgi:transcriptional regulator with XRE-family HTH domain